MNFHRRIPFRFCTMTLSLKDDGDAINMLLL